MPEHSEGVMTDAERKRTEGADDGSASFRVIDRRRFAPDGTERDGEEPASSAIHEPATTKADASPPGPDPEEGPGFVMSEPRNEASAALPEPSLSTLLLSLSTQALMHLGEIPDVTTGEPTRDLQAARSLIDLLGVLEKKTRGNLDPSESALLERILYDLRMRYVELSRA